MAISNRISELFFRFLHLFTLNFSIMILHNDHYKTVTFLGFQFRPHFFFWFTLTCILLTLARMSLLLYASIFDRYDIGTFYEPYIASLRIGVPAQDSLLTLSVIFFQFHICNMLDCTCRKLFIHFPVQMRDFHDWGVLEKTTKFDILNRNWKQNQQSFLANFRVNWNPHYFWSDKGKLIKLLKGAEFSYFVSLIGLNFGLLIISIILGVIYAQRCSGCASFGPKMLRSYVDIYFLVYLIFLPGILGPWFLFHVFYIYMKAIEVPYRRLLETLGNRKWLDARRLFYFVLIHYRSLNALGVTNTFTFSLCLAVFSAAILSILVFAIKGLPIELQLVFIAIVLVTFIIIGIVVQPLITSTVTLYSLSKPYRRIFLSNIRPVVEKDKKIRVLLRMSFFYEIVHTRKQFNFRLGNLGKMTRSTLLLKFLPVYSSFIMSILPLIKNVPLSENKMLKNNVFQL